MGVLLTSTRWLSLLLDRLLLCRRRGNRLLGLLRGCICWRLCRSALRVTLLNLHRLRGFCLLWLLLRGCFNWWRGWLCADRFRLLNLWLLRLCGLVRLGLVTSSQ